MKYVDWVETVLVGLRDAKAAQASPSIYLRDEALATHLGVASEDRGLEAVRDAIRDLERLGAVEAKNYYNIVLTWPARSARPRRRSSATSTSARWQPPDGCSTPWATTTAPDVFRLQVDTSPRPAVVQTSMGESRTPVSSDAR